MKKGSKEYLDIMEHLILAQLETVRELKGEAPHQTGGEGGLNPSRPVGRRRQNKSKSQVDIAYDVLTRCGEPKHALEIIHLAQEWHGVSLNRDSLVSALLKKVAQGDRFTKEGKNTFGLMEWQPR